MQRAAAQQLLSPDPALQAAALKCLRPFRLPYLPGPLLQRLLRLADNATLREELVGLPMAAGAEGGIPDEHRAGGRGSLRRGPWGRGDGSVCGGEGCGGGARQALALCGLLRRPKPCSPRPRRPKPPCHYPSLQTTGFVPLLIMTLFPKMRKRSGRLGGRGAPGSARAAVLNALAALQPLELRPLLELLLEPLGPVFSDPDAAGAAGDSNLNPDSNGGPSPKRRRVVVGGGASAARVPGGFDAADAESLDRCRLVPPPWWSARMGGEGFGWWLGAVDAHTLAKQPLRRKQGYLNALEDLLGHLGFRLQPLLPPLLAIATRILDAAVEPLRRQAEAEADGASGEQGREQEAAPGAPPRGGEDAESVARARELRSQSLRLIASALRRFPASADFNPLWGPLLDAVSPLLPRLAAEAAADKAPPALELALALASNPGTARVLADLPSQRLADPDADAAFIAASGAAGAADAEAAAVADAAALAAGLPDWAEARRGGALLGAVVGALGARNRSEAARDAALSVIEKLLALQPPELLRRALLPWVPALLGALKASVEAIVSTPPPRGGRVRVCAACAGVVRCVDCCSSTRAPPRPGFGARAAHDSRGAEPSACSSAPSRPPTPRRRALHAHLFWNAEQAAPQPRARAGRDGADGLPRRQPRGRGRPGRRARQHAAARRRRRRRQEGRPRPALRRPRAGRAGGAVGRGRGRRRD